MNEADNRTSTDKPRILDLLLEQSLLQENIEFFCEKHSYHFFTSIVDDCRTTKLITAKNHHMVAPELQELFVYLQRKQYLLLASPFAREDPAVMETGDPIRIQFYTGTQAYQVAVNFERCVEVQGNRLAIRTSFPEQLVVLHVRKQIRVSMVTNSHIGVRINKPAIGEFFPHLKDLHEGGLAFCMPFNYRELLPIGSEICLCVNYPGEKELELRGHVIHFTLSCNKSKCLNSEACLLQSGLQKAICGIAFETLHQAQIMQIFKLMVLIQREYIIQEKKVLINFNLALERQVQEQTSLLREKDIQLLEMDRTVGIVTLAAGIAHEINNPLSFISSAIHFIRKGVLKMVETSKYWDGKPVPEQLLKEYQDFLSQINFKQIVQSLDNKFESIKRGIERIMNIVNNLKSFSRIDREEVERVDINKCIEEVLSVFSVNVEENVEFAKELQEAPLVECCVSDINQCLFHVVSNAVDAVEHNGIIKISTLHDRENNQIVMQVVDNGCGMAPEVLKQAFNPFFTTKPVGVGTGIGLSIVDRIVKRHNGTINIRSKPGFGTTVTLAIPVDCTIATKS